MKLNKRQLSEFEKEGWIFLPDVFSQREINILMKEVPKIFAMQRKEVWREKNHESVRTAFAAHKYNQAFRALAAHPRLIEPVMQLVNGPVYMHQFKINGKAAFDGE